jgi:hypothetical protein
MASRLAWVNAVTVNDMLDGRKLLKINCMDRVYLTLSVRSLLVGGQVVRFLTAHEHNSIPSPVLLERRGLVFRQSVVSLRRSQRHPSAEFRGQERGGPARGARRIFVAGTQDRQSDAADAATAPSVSLLTSIAAPRDVAA